ncbi:hypothetical protein [Pseudobacteroides cellulosolvens]|uniref:FG-GAP repeat protein n=1 Tax=Pseudobacteroides cellulosolvens ATCC 35603 = DSM 2933 TaxID=398512 RepID=A0A0L6JSN0_9FIRM|nr:hypothetical protein [Pseudobacteroides cellulosolvens]KNY28818.1 hypothetical protein Bccel_4092 [Pseudobacteroides cellulosolvens ATCC 35603 = DSM 2933]
MYSYRPEAANPNIIAHARGDVNGNRIPDNVFLTGIKTPDSPFVQNIMLLIQDGATNKPTIIPFEENAGYNPTLFLGDFTGDGVDDILISIASGGSGGTMYHYIFSFFNNISHLLFDYKVFDEKFEYEVNYRNNYKVEVLSTINNKKYVLDISIKGKDYLNEIYDNNGNLKSPIAGFVNPLSGLYPVDFDSNRVFELLTYQKIAGRYNADSLGYVLNTLKWQNNSFSLLNQNIAIFGAEQNPLRFCQP